MNVNKKTDKELKQIANQIVYNLLDDKFKNLNLDESFTIIDKSGDEKDILLQERDFCSLCHFTRETLKGILESNERLNSNI